MSTFYAPDPDPIVTRGEQTCLLLMATLIVAFAIGACVLALLASGNGG